jgi:serine-type D-Ala-D-Ala carboxypeptidase (penicillin-binding protein 5/6)
MRPERAPVGWFEEKAVVDLSGLRISHRLIVLAVTLAIAGLVCVTSATASSWDLYRPEHHAAYRHRRHHRHRPRKASVPPYRAALLEDADSGQVLFASNADMEWPPASMAKMMLLLVTEDQIKAGHVSLDAPVRISARSAHTGGSRLGLHEGAVYPLRELMKAALIRSANDAAVAIAQKVAGSVTAAVSMMNARARSLGMTGTRYETVDGLPPHPRDDVDRTTAHDLAIVAREIIYHTDLLKWSREQTVEFDGGVALLHNTNHLVGHFDGCDGLKTGFTFESGFNLTATAKRGNLRLISVILGAPSNPERFIQSARLMQWGFDHFSRLPVLRKGQPLPVWVQVESGPKIRPVSAATVNVVVRNSELSDIKLDYSVPSTVDAPLASGEPIGQVIVRDGAQILAQVDAVCPVTVDPAAGNSTVAPRDSIGIAGIRPAADSHQAQEGR